MPEVVFRLRSQQGDSVPGAAVLAAYPNETYRTGRTDSDGRWQLDLYRTDQEMTVLAAAESYLPLSETVLPDNDVIDLEMERSACGSSSVLFTKSTGHIPRRLAHWVSVGISAIRLDGSLDRSADPCRAPPSLNGLLPPPR